MPETGEFLLEANGEVTVAAELFQEGEAVPLQKTTKEALEANDPRKRCLVERRNRKTLKGYHPALNANGIMGYLPNLRFVSSLPRSKSLRTASG